MDADELDIQINELEHRLDRLRALYEQYFLGIEKIEPQVARKDVDRRFWALRKVKIRNTARRFKLQTLIQRYNTFQQHWGRICREIENGTYRRQMLRAERRLGHDAQAQDQSPESRRAERAAAAQQAVDEASTDLASLMEGDLDLAAEAKRALEAVMQPAKPATPDPKPAPPAAKPAAPPTNPKIPAARALDRLELDDLDLGPTPRSPPPNRLTPAATAAAKPEIPRSRPPLPQRPAQAPPRTPPSADLRPPVPAAPPHRPPPPGAPARPVQAPIGRPLPRAPAPGTPAAPAPPLTRAPAPARATPAAQPARSSPIAPARPTPAAGARGAAAPVTAAAVASPGPVKAPQPARPIRSAVGGSARASEIFGGPAPRAPAAARAAAPSGLSEDRVKAVHAKLMAAKKQLNEQSGVSVGGLKKQLDASYQKLQAKHRGKQIDFDVVVKDGKAVVKPKIR